MANKYSLSRIIRLPRRLSLREAKNEQRENEWHALERLFKKLYDSSDSVIPADLLQSLPINLQPLDLETDDIPNTDRFFRPWSVVKLETHVRSTEVTEANEDVAVVESILKDDTPRYKAMGGCKTWEWASELCYRLMWEVAVAPRKGTEGDLQTIKTVYGWRCLPYLPDDYRFQPWLCSQQGSWYPKYYFYIPGNSPHIKICMYHNADGVSGQILREELLAMLAAMISRLGQNKFRKHLIIPVCTPNIFSQLMLFSFVGKQHGRIFLAHFDGKGLVVRMSELYPFMAGEEDFHQNLFLFTRYLAGEIDPRGETTRFRHI
ncbi:hypothetical protein BDV25DRAFT_138770 [Aspergillus avenaceus]|uniref:Uncharacterized protein n=1 Tax=Aspergillus avenaceus TaxID=36643 RepID=A0A5N6TYZ1_ASPAV|nr:hypothetical protein BDV25DRAFT_138770 [Aspergillus avenaceus]